VNLEHARGLIAPIVSELARAHRAKLEEIKADRSRFDRPDFLWHALLQSFATMGRTAGQVGLIRNQSNYSRVTYEALAALAPEARATQVREVCVAAKVRMPGKKAEYILGCFDLVEGMGGPAKAKEALIAMRGHSEKEAFLRTFPGIGEKYARNIMMDVYHEEFRDSIAIDIRIKRISEALGVSFRRSYPEHEAFYLEVARAAGLNGWEVDRLLYWFQDEVIEKVEAAKQLSHAGSTDRLLK